MVILYVNKEARNGNTKGKYETTQLFSLVREIEDYENQQYKTHGSISNDHTTLRCSNKNNFAFNECKLRSFK